MKLKVIVKEFFDKKEQKYVRQEKEPVIEREEERAKQLIAAGVCEELDECGVGPGSIAPDAEPLAESAEEAPEEAMPEPEEETPKSKKKK